MQRASPQLRTVGLPGLRRVVLVVTLQIALVVTDGCRREEAATEAGPAVRGWEATELVMQPVGPMLGERAEHAAVALPDGRVLVLGGRHEPLMDWRNDGELYDPTTGNWTMIPAAPHPLAGPLTATALPDGRVLVIGGPERRAMLFEPGEHRWEEGPSLSVPRSQHRATLLQDGDVLITGGYAETGRILEAAEQFDSSRGEFVPVPDMAEARVEHTATLLLDGSVLVIGGLEHFALYGLSHILASAEVFDPNNARWSQAAPLAAPRSGHTATRLGDGSVLVVGGSAGNTQSAEAERWSPTSGAFSPAGRVGGRQGHVALPLPSGRVVVLGGHNASWRSVFAVDVFREGGWSRSPASFLGGPHAAGVVLPDGSLLVTGGLGGYYDSPFDPGHAPQRLASSADAVRVSEVTR
jgi:hypothetical protein